MALAVCYSVVSLLDFYKKVFEDKDGKVVLFQKPNTLLLVWLVSTFVVALTHGRLQTNLYILSAASLVIWALLEIFQGVTNFRRILGAVVLLAVTWSLFSR